jgi:hypothetical protein
MTYSSDMPLEEQERRRKESRRRWYEKNKPAILARQRAYQKDRPAKVREIQKRWRDANKESERLRARVKNWRLLPKPTRPESAVCECCGASQKKALSLDHCHETGAFRGWLCSKCNLGIGKLGDSLESLLKAVKYLQRARQ